MNKLRFNYEVLPPLHSVEIARRETHWGWITLSVEDGNGTILRQVFKWQWNVDELLDWLLLNEVAIKTEDLSQIIHYDTSYSIARVLYEFYESDDEYEDDLYDQLYNYRSEHGLRFGMRGTDLPDIYIGKNGLFVEISFYSSDDNWQYNIDATDFFEQIHDSKASLLM